MKIETPFIHHEYRHNGAQKQRFADVIIQILLSWFGSNVANLSNFIDYYDFLNSKQQSVFPAYQVYSQAYSSHDSK